MPALLEFPTARDPDVVDCDMLCAANYPPAGVRWLWPGRIPIGKVSLLVGDPGNGKSLIALDIAARVTRGTAWPATRAEGGGGKAEGKSTVSDLPPFSPGSVIILSAEDDLGDTIRPRLDAAGADPSRVFVLPSVVDLRHDFAKLRAAVERAPNCRLIIIDPVNAFVGPGDSHFHTVFRRVFQPLAQLAAEKGIAVLAITHLRKHDGAAIQRAIGSMGFVAAARAVWTVCRDHTTPGQHLLLPLKNNFAPDTPGLAFTIESSAQPWEEGYNAPRINWQTSTITTSTADALTPPQKPRGAEAAEVNLACKWLRDELAGGPQPAICVIANGLIGGFAERTLRRALDMLGGETKKVDFHAGWEWVLPNQPVPETQESDLKCVAPTVPCSPSPVPSPMTPGDNLAASPELEDFENATWPLRENTANLKDATCPLRENPEDSSRIGLKKMPFRPPQVRTMRVVSLNSAPLSAMTAQSQMDPWMMANMLRRFERSTKRNIRRRDAIRCRDP